MLDPSSTSVRAPARTSRRPVSDRAIEPSDVMAAQRRPTIPPALRASAGELPLRDHSVDAAMAVLTIHHWDEELERGMRSCGASRARPVVDPHLRPLVSGEMWLMADYLPEVADARPPDLPVASAARRLARAADTCRDRADFARHAGLDAGVVLGSSRARARRAGEQRDLWIRAPRRLRGPTRRPRRGARSRQRALGRAPRQPAEARRLRRGASSRRQRP